jgi:ATP-binding cassette subfamily C (CFTR/MRP) protein 10
VFTSLALVNILIMPLNAFPWVLNALIEANVSIQRLNTFFALTDIDLDKYYSSTNNGDIYGIFLNDLILFRRPA